MSFNEAVSKWETEKLSQLTDYISRGITPKYTEDKNRSILVVNQRCIREGKVLFEDARRHDIEKKKISEEKFLRDFDVLVNSTGVGTLGRVSQIKKVHEPTTVDSHVTIVRGNADYIDKKYLGYAIKAQQSIIENMAEGSTGQTELSRKRLGDEIVIGFPKNKQEQKAIAHILSTLDDKIEVNNQINKTLENMAHAYFDDMFPNVAAGDTTIGEYITPKRGKNLLSKDAISGEVPVIAGGLSPATYHNVSNTQSPVITISASGANAGFVNLWTVPVWSSDSSFIDYGMTKDVYFWYVMLKKRQKEIYDSQTGSAQPHIYPKHITIMPTIKLNVDEINLYTKRVTPLFKKIANNLYEISKLQLIRDTLLPKLMSGEIRVPMDEEGDLS